MGETAEVLAREFGVTREEQDRFALESHQRAARAWSEGRLAEEVAPLPLPPRYEKLAEKDNGVRENQSIEALAKLKPWFDREYGTVTAGNSSQITDGAAAVVLASEERARAEHLPILGRVRGPRSHVRSRAHGARTRRDADASRAGTTLAQVGSSEINGPRRAGDRVCARDGVGLLRARGWGSTRRWARWTPRTNVKGRDRAGPPSARAARGWCWRSSERPGATSRWCVATLCIGGGQGGAIVLERA
jgi:acetyl-CoA acyltransferase